MKAFFGIYLLLLVGVFVLWSIEPLHRAQEASSITAGAPLSAIAANASTGITHAGKEALIKKSAAPSVEKTGTVPEEHNSTPATSTPTLPPADTATTTPPEPEVVAAPAVASTTVVRATAEE